MPEISENWTTVVRLFPDHAASPIWFPGPIDYPDAHLSVELERDLRAWDDLYYASLGLDHDWPSVAAENSFMDAGRLLAQRLADELGLPFVVEFSQRRFRATGEARNAAAAQAFAVLAAASRERWEGLERLREQSGSFGWSGYSPMND